jgi:hypothetical protein
MFSSLTPRRTALALLAPLLTVGIVATAAPASAIPFEGDPTPTTCLRLAPRPDAAPADSTWFVAAGVVLVLSTDC